MKQALTTGHHKITKLLFLSEHLVSHFMVPLFIGALFFYTFGNLTLLLSQKKTVGLPLDKIRYPVYGPFPESLERSSSSYSFNNVSKSFGGFPLWRIGDLTHSDFHELITEDVPRKLKSRMERYLKIGLETAEKYQVDPFWVMAVMWVESHFNPKAQSHVYATGLMQILPGTGHFLYQKMGISLSPKLSYGLIEIPENNIQLGVFYLRKLLGLFASNYTLATVAYNMGPTTVRKRLKYGLPVGVSNLYLDKVRKAYSHLSKGYRRYLVTTRPTYLQTYAAWPPPPNPDKQILAKLQPKKTTPNGKRRFVFYSLPAM